MVKEAPLFTSLSITPVSKKLFVVNTLHIELLHEVEHPILGLSFVKPHKRNKTFKPSCRRPVEDYISSHMVIEVFKRIVNDCKNSFFIIGTISIKHKHLADEENCPHIIFVTLFTRTRCNPTIILLTFNDRVDIFFCPRNQVIILKLICKGKQHIGCPS